MEYQYFLTNDDLAHKGYDLENGDHLTWEGHFPTQHDAVVSFIEDAVDPIYNVIARHRGNEYASSLFSAFETEVCRNKYPNMYSNLKKACVEQAIFFLENGDYDALAKDEGARVVAPKALAILYNEEILV